MTPGPWKSSPNYRCASPLKGALIMAGSKELATVSAHEVGSQEECEANARVMAAAPELLAACQHMLEIFPLGSLEIAAKFGPDVDPDTMYVSACEQAEAAIRQAKGE